MTTANYELEKMNETAYTQGGEYKGIPKSYTSNWIAYYLMANRAKSIEDVFELPKFKMHAKDYHFMTITLPSGLQHWMLFCKGACCYSEYGIPRR